MIAGPTTLDYTPMIVIPISECQRLSAIPELVVEARNDTTTAEYGIFAPYYSKLRQIGSDASLWVDEEPPSQTAITWAYLIISRLEAIGLQPTKVVASAEGGTAICFVDGSKYADIESLNSGAILGVLSDKYGEPFVWDIEQSESGIALATSRIREFINSP